MNQKEIVNLYYGLAPYYPKPLQYVIRSVFTYAIRKTQKELRDIYFSAEQLINENQLVDGFYTPKTNRKFLIHLQLCRKCFPYIYLLIDEKGTINNDTLLEVLRMSGNEYRLQSNITTITTKNVLRSF